MMAGAIVSTSSDGGSIWYNPAGLSALRGTRLDVNVSAYAIRFGATANFDSQVPGATETRLSLLDIDVVPAALTLTRKFGKFGVGLGIFVPAQSSGSLRTHLAAPGGPAGTSLEFGYDSKSRVQEYHLGPGFGWDPLPNLSLGASFLANYRTRYESVDVAAAIETPDSQTAYADHSTRDSIGVGLELVLGTQYQLTPTWRLGFTLRSPALRVGQAVDRVETTLAASSDGTLENSILYDESIGIGTQAISPFRVHLGVSHEFDSVVGSVESSLSLPFENSLFGVPQRATWNGRLGLKGEINEFLSLGGGIFTDRSSAQTPENFQDRRIDFYGATLAFDWKNSHGIYSKNGRTLEAPESIVFGTTLALSYALGVGELTSAEVGLAPAGGVELTPITANVTAHEFTLHISSSIGE